MSAWIKKTIFGSPSPSSEDAVSPSAVTSGDAQTHQSPDSTTTTSTAVASTANSRHDQLHPYSLKHSPSSLRDSTENRRRILDLESKLSNLSSAKVELERKIKRVIEERDAAKREAEQAKNELQKVQAKERERENKKIMAIAERDNVKREAAELELKFLHLSSIQANIERERNKILSERDNAKREAEQTGIELRKLRAKEREREGEASRVTAEMESAMRKVIEERDNAEQDVKELMARLHRVQANEDGRERERSGAIKERDRAKQQVEERGRQSSKLFSSQADVEGETSNVIAERDRANQDLDQANVELKKLRAKERERESERSKAVAERDDAKRQVEWMKNELEKLRAKDGDRRRATLDGDELRATKFKLASSEKQHEATKRLLAAKIDEVKGMQLFTTKADKVSIGDVISLVHSLNAEIHQASAIIADSLHFSSSPQEQVPDQEVSKANTIMLNSLGQDIANAIWRLRNARKGKQNQECDPTVVEYALQVAMTGVCTEVINNWAPNAEADHYLESVYATIQTKESQAVAGRWRALTRAQIGNAKDSTSIINHLVDQLVSILVVAGCSKSQVQVDDFRERSHDHLAGIADLTVCIRTAVGESITSVDMKAYICRPGAGFRMEYMEDMYGEAATEDGGKAIAGTTELGLLQKQQQASGPFEEPVVKAKVLLASIL